MRNLPKAKAVLLIFLTIVGSVEGNVGPDIQFLWPHGGEDFSNGTFAKLKVSASDLDGFVKQVDFFVEDQLIGTVTAPPYNLVWVVNSSGAGAFVRGNVQLKVEAVDDTGGMATATVPVFVSDEHPTFPVVEVISPATGAMYPVPGNFTFAAEVLASVGESGPVEFYVGTNLVGTLVQTNGLKATNPPMALEVTGLEEGEYRVYVKYAGLNRSYCDCGSTSIRVVRLGLKDATVSQGKLIIDGVTAFPNRAVVIEKSSDLKAWVPAETVTPTTTSFVFDEVFAEGANPSWYRARFAD
jgi:hypothetical protein